MKQEHITYGGELEMLVVNEAGELKPVDTKTQTVAQNGVNHIQDSRGKAPDQGYDSSSHLLEIGAGVHKSLIDLFYALKASVVQYNYALQTSGLHLTSLSYHPFANVGSAYNTGVLPKPVYGIIKGFNEGRFNVSAETLNAIFPHEDRSELGRNWKHELGTMAASAQPWNSLSLETAADQIGVLQSTGWLFNLLTANSPYANGALSDKRDVRLDMWGQDGIMSTARYAQDKRMTTNMPNKPTTLAGYFKHLYTCQRPMIIPTQDSSGKYKTSFLAVVQPLSESFTVLDYLKMETCNAVNIDTGEIVQVAPSVAHFVNGYDFLYFPQYGARLRMFLPQADNIDPARFVRAIESNDEKLLHELLRQGGIEQAGGALCAENRVPAAVLPTESHNSWHETAIPFVLQTALVRGYVDVQHIFEKYNLSWQTVAHVLPQATNNNNFGFEARAENINAGDLAQKIWQAIQKYLSTEELELVGNTIETILNTRKAPAERQIEFVQNKMAQGATITQALIGLVQHQFFSMPQENSTILK